MVRLVQTRPALVKEYIQSTSLDKCLIPASPSEQYVTLAIDQNMIDQWIKEGYSHLHIGAVCVILSLHGRKGLPITARLALLNTIYTHQIPTWLPSITIHQLAYRLQDHALDLLFPGHNGDTIFIKAEKEDEVPTILQIPKQLPRDKLTEIMPLEWITNYEKAFQNIAPVAATDTTFEADGSPIYTNKINGHFIWDVDPNMCDADCKCRKRLKGYSKSCKPSHKPRKPNDPDSPWIGLLPSQPNILVPTLPPPILCYMTSDYDCDFPPLEPSSNSEKTRFSRPFVQTTEVQPDGSLKQPSQAEQILNWQSHNARAQNRVVNYIDQKIDRVTRHVSQHDHHLKILMPLLETCPQIYSPELQSYIPIFTDTLIKDILAQILI
ncbi:hypothetical protein Q3G72_028932 [Acer saccharum]|nr:hypothetical protein Q3G72_028932 [Acer saccharum]